MSLPSPIRCVAFGPVSIAALLWREGRALSLTAIVKAGFSLSPGAACRIEIPPPPLAPRDVRAPDRQTITAASDLAPHKPRADVTFTGAAHAPPGRPARVLAVRLAVFRGSTPLVDRTEHVPGSRAAPAPAPEPLASIPVTAFAPLAMDAPERAARLGAATLRAVSSALPDLPAGFDRAYFQVAPAGQQCAALAGDEWIVLDGLHPSLARVQSQLPEVRAAARVIDDARIGAGPREIELSLDTLAIFGDAQRCELVWRGAFPVASIDALRQMRVEATLATAGAAPRWPEGEDDRRGEAATAKTMAFAAPSAPLPFREASTVAMNDADQSASAAKAVAPFDVRAAGQAVAGVGADIPGAPWSRVPAAAPPLDALEYELIAAPEPSPAAAPVVSPPAPPEPPPMLGPILTPASKPKPKAPATPRATARPARVAPRRSAKQAPPPEPRSPSEVAEALREAGASPEDVAALLAALAPR